MDDPPNVCIGERIRDLRGEPAHFVEWLAWLASEQPCEAAAVYERHDQPGEPFVLADVVNGDDVWMGELRRRLRLTREASADCLVERELRWQDLDGNPPVQPPVTCPVNHGHSAATDLVFDLVLGSDSGCEPFQKVVCHSSLRVASRPVVRPASA
jgi:hypothetical protein